MHNELQDIVPLLVDQSGSRFCFDVHRKSRPSFVVRVVVEVVNDDYPIHRIVDQFERMEREHEVDVQRNQIETVRAQIEEWLGESATRLVPADDRFIRGQRSAYEHIANRLKDILDGEGL